MKSVIFKFCSEKVLLPSNFFFRKKSSPPNFFRKKVCAPYFFSKKVFAPCRWSRPGYPINFEPSLKWVRSNDNSYRQNRPKFLKVKSHLKTLLALGSVRTLLLAGGNLVGYFRKVIGVEIIDGDYPPGVFLKGLKFSDKKIRSLKFIGEI